jgi:hypothetical protein
MLLKVERFAEPATMVKFRFALACQTLGPIADPALCALADQIPASKSEKQAVDATRMLDLVQWRGRRLLLNGWKGSSPVDGLIASVEEEPLTVVPELLHIRDKTDEKRRVIDRVLEDAFVSTLEPEQFEKLYPLIKLDLVAIDTEPIIKRLILAYAERAGPKAKVAIPELEDLLRHRDAGVRVAATNALVKVDPEAAVKAGIVLKTESSSSK